MHRVNVFQYGVRLGVCLVGTSYRRVKSPAAGSDLEQVLIILTIQTTRSTKLLIPIFEVKM